MFTKTYVQYLPVGCDRLVLPYMQCNNNIIMDQSTAHYVKSWKKDLQAFKEI